ncbi:MAG TPA: sigma-70 family RNA polymerase sigma factor [Bryobacteraceae bacterium]|nr:sigma-70 family RNA polymerase sigma factor [Bryobacteraceae bacterium]
MPDRTDVELIDDIRQGRGEALGLLFDRYNRLIFDVARKILRDQGEAEDLMQDVFLEVYRKAGLYQAGKGSVKVWLLQYAYHRSFNRRKYLTLRSFYDASPTAALAESDLAGEWGGRERLTPQGWEQVLKRGMKELNDKERQIVRLVAFDAHTVREASEQLRESYGNGRNHYYRGLKKLREFLGRNKSRATEVNDAHS